jgi:hypothetical protein
MQGASMLFETWRTGKKRSARGLLLAVNRLVAGSNPARGANANKRLSKNAEPQKWPWVPLGYQTLSRIIQAEYNEWAAQACFPASGFNHARK